MVTCVVMSRTMLCWVACLWCLVLCYVALCCVVLRCVALCVVLFLLCCFVACCAVLWCGVLCYVVVWCGVLCCAVLCCVVLCCVVLCCVLSTCPRQQIQQATADALMHAQSVRLTLTHDDEPRPTRSRSSSTDSIGSYCLLPLPSEDPSAYMPDVKGRGHTRNVINTAVLSNIALDSLTVLGSAEFPQLSSNRTNLVTFAVLPPRVRVRGFGFPRLWVA